MTTTLVALYDDIRTAHRVVDRLIDRGFARKNVSLVARDVDEEYARYVDTDQDYRTDNEAAEGAGIGAVIGGIGGLLVGLGALAIPGVGPVVAAGPIVAGLTGAGVGAVAGGIVGALVDMGLPEEEAQYYAEGVRRGGAVVAVQVADDRVEEAVDIMEGFNPVNINERAERWRESGWTGFDHESEPWTRQQIGTEYRRYGIEHPDFTAHTRDGAVIHDIVDEERPERTEGTRRTTRPTAGTEDEVSIDVVEEDVKVGKRQVERGRIRVRKYLVEEPVEEQVTLRETHVDVERRPVNRSATNADLEAFEEGTIEMTETAEEVTVEKQPRVTEEIRIRRETREHTETVRDTKRHTEVEVEEIGDRNPGRRGMTHNDHESEFRRHYETTYGTAGQWEDYQPAYRYGYELATNEQYANRSWNDIESTARRDWADRYQSDTGAPWDDVSDAVRYGWERTRTGVSDRDYLTDDSQFRRHYETTYANTDYTYDQYQPAYRFGHQLGVDDRYVNREWREIEPEARNQWRNRYGDNQTTWDEIKGAVRHGWETVRKRV